MKMSDILSSFSIILAVYTFIWSMWNNEIESSLRLKEENGINIPNNKKNFETITKVLKTKQIPLFIISGMVTIIMLPSVFEIITSSIKLIKMGNARYDVVKTVIIFLFLMFVFISLLQLLKTIEVFKKRKKLAYE